MTKISFEFLNEERSLNIQATHTTKTLTKLDTTFKIDGLGSFRIRLTNFKDLISDDPKCNRMRAYNVTNLTPFNRSVHFSENIRPRRGKLS